MIAKAPPGPDQFAKCRAVDIDLRDACLTLSAAAVNAAEFSPWLLRRVIGEIAASEDPRRAAKLAGELLAELLPEVVPEWRSVPVDSTD